MKAEYISHMGNDLTVVNAARVSFDKTAKWEWYDEDGRGPAKEPSPCGQYFNIRKIAEGDQRLIKYLAKHGHFTPFTHPQITLRYTVPIFVARQEFKHIVGFTRNEISRRYVDNAPEFFTPEMWRSRPTGSVKQGSGQEEVKVIRDHGEYADAHENISDVYVQFTRQALGFYNDLLHSGVAPEQARMVLPQSMYTSYYVTGSLASFARFYNQRSDSHAQKEIQDLAEMVKEVVEPLYPVSWEALTTQS